MKAERLFYKKFVGDITSIGFKLNPYDPSVAKKLIKRKKMTMVWHVYEIKVIHNRNKIVTIMGKWLKKTYERLFEDRSGNMKIYRDNIHEYLGMTLYFLEAWEVKITMISFIEKMVKDFDNYDDTMKISATPSSYHLFKTR